MWVIVKTTIELKHLSFLFLSITTKLIFRTDINGWYIVYLAKLVMGHRCEKCGKEFRQKGHYDAHQKRKTPCLGTGGLLEALPNNVQDVITTKVNEKVRDLLVSSGLHKKCLGQYFTISEDLQRWVFDHVAHKDQCLLEPSFGAGHLLKPFLDMNKNYPVHGYEIDSSVQPIVTWNQHQQLCYGDFMEREIAVKYKTIIGNPPYVKQSTGNLYLKFIEKCSHLLEEGGELLFIVPSDFLKVTSASKLIEEMTQNGDFTHFWFPHQENLFEGASIDVVVFRYEKHLGKTSIQTSTIVNGEERFIQIRKGIITFSENEIACPPLSELFHVYVGIVSGKDEAYRSPLGNLGVLTDKDRIESFIFAETFPTPNEEANQHLLSKKNELMSRKIRKFNEKNWFEWGAPRNIGAMKEYSGKPCIYVRNITRKKEVAFLDKMQHFGGSLLCLLPKKEMTVFEMTRIMEYINGSNFQQNYVYANRFKIGQKQLSNAMVPLVEL